MEPAELEEYRAGRALGCQDCTSDFAAAMAREGRCNGIPGDVAGPIITTLEMLADALPVPRKPTPFIGGTTRVAVPREERTVTEPRQIHRQPASPQAQAYRELAEASEAAAEAQERLDAAQLEHRRAQERLAKAFAAAKKPPRAVATSAGTTTTGREPSPNQSSTSEPGVLSPRQQEALDVFAKHRDRPAAAAELGIPIINLENILDAVGRKGHLPAELVPLLPPRFAQFATQQESTG